jgi:hypothetical protein
VGAFLVSFGDKFALTYYNIDMYNIIDQWFSIGGLRTLRGLFVDVRGSVIV